MAERCIACSEPFKAGDEHHPDFSGGFIHARCCDPTGFIDLDTEVPMPAPEPLIWPADGEPRSFLQ